MFQINIQKYREKRGLKNRLGVIRRTTFFAGCTSSILAVGVLGGIFNPTVGRADFQCKASVSYGWQRGEAGEQLTFFSSAEGVAETEEGARAVLAERVNRVETKAIAECRRLHENLSQCVATKYSSLSGVLGSMSFSSRKSLEDSIDKDCQAVQGVCTGSKASEVKCQERKPQESQPAATQSAPGGDASGESGSAPGEKVAETDGKKEGAPKK